MALARRGRWSLPTIHRLPIAGLITFEVELSCELARTALRIVRLLDAVAAGGTLLHEATPGPDLCGRWVRHTDVGALPMQGLTFNSRRVVSRNGIFWMTQTLHLGEAFDVTTEVLGPAQLEALTERSPLAWRVLDARRAA